MKKIRLLSLLPALLLSISSLQANNILVSNVRIADDNPSGGYAEIEFDLSWENSWRTVIAPPANHDAAWVFVKYRTPGGAWQHAWLHDAGHSDGSGTAATMEVGLLDDRQPFDPTANPGIGVLVYRSAVGSGTFSAADMRLRWNYYANGVPPGTPLEIQVYAIEMVLAPGGAFSLGDGASAGAFRQAGSNTAFQVTSAGAALKCAQAGADDAQLEGAGIWVDGDGGISRSTAGETDLNPDYPTGFRGFYCMKYEISQGQYRDFLNTLTRTQQQARMATDISGTSAVNRYVLSNTATPQNRNGLRCAETLPAGSPIELYCDLDGDDQKNEATDGEWIACNYLTWADGAAYLDWCGLRPLTELEYEKACRGPQAPVGSEYAWGATGIAGSAYALADAGAAAEGIGTNFSPAAGNTAYAATVGALSGPLRVGIFAANTANTGRLTAGAGYFGAMEMSGNLWERTVTLGNPTGRAYTGLHGNGLPAANGDADALHWPGTDAVGAGFRGGSWEAAAAALQLSDRSRGAQANPDRAADTGFRGCRSVRENGVGY